jgi:putative membrane protein
MSVMMWGSGWGWGGWLAMMLTMVLFWGLIVAGIIAIVRYLGGTRQGRQDPDRVRPEAENILAERFAHGEIDQEEYTRRRDLLRSG